jgi:hypothetical protein
LIKNQIEIATDDMTGLKVQFNHIWKKFFAGQHGGYFLKKRWLLKRSIGMSSFFGKSLDACRIGTSAGLRRATTAPRAKPTYAIKTARFLNTQLR